MSLSSQMEQQVRMARLAVSVLAFAIAGGGAYWWYGVEQPTQVAESTQLRERHQRLQEKNQTTRKAILEFGNSGIREALEGARAQRELFARMLPRADSVTDTRLLSRVTETARSRNLRVGDLKPLPEVTRTDGFIERGYQARIIGPYHSVGVVLATLLNFERVTLIRKVKFDGAPPRGLGDSTEAGGSLGTGNDYLKKVAAVLGRTQGPWNVEASFEIVEFFTPKPTPPATPAPGTAPAAAPGAPAAAPPATSGTSAPPAKP